MSVFDCIVIGSGHAGACAALSAVDSGCQRVLIIDKCPAEWAGGNGYFTAGAHRTVHDGLQDLLPLVCNVSPEAAKSIDIEPYTPADFTQDIMRLGDNRSDPLLVKALVDNSRDAIRWLANRVHVPFTLSFNRQAYEVNGRQKFWGGMALAVKDGGKGLIAAHLLALKESGVEIWFDCPAVQLLSSSDVVNGVIIKRRGETLHLTSRSVILAAGGYEASPDLRVKYLGPGWDQARVRGTPYNTGDGFVLAKVVGAKIAGDWQGCHSTAWDANACPNSGDRELSNQFTKSGYPLGIVVNAHGDRFFDEGFDMRNYTYAKLGREILAQPRGFAFQIWDARVTDWLRKEEYGDGVVEKITADNLDDLATQLADKGLDSKVNVLQTLSDYNLAVYRHRAAHPSLVWNPSIKDGLSTEFEISSSSKIPPVPKSNWALPIDKPPFLAVKVACGITFTFGGLAIDPDTAGVQSINTGQPIKGLFCTGEMVGGLYYGNYPGGSGLTAGAVFGRKAGRAAAGGI